MKGDEQGLLHNRKPTRPKGINSRSGSAATLRNPAARALEAVIVEVGLEKGLDVLAVFRNGTARYINQTGKLLIWETSDETSLSLSKNVFEKSQLVVDQMGIGKLPRRPPPAQGNARITLLLSDGLTFGEAPANVLFADPLAGPALGAAAQLMKYITEKHR